MMDLKISEEVSTKRWHLIISTINTNMRSRVNLDKSPLAEIGSKIHHDAYPTPQTIEY